MTRVATRTICAGTSAIKIRGRPWRLFLDAKTIPPVAFERGRAQGRNPASSARARRRKSAGDPSTRPFRHFFRHSLSVHSARLTLPREVHSRFLGLVPPRFYSPHHIYFGRAARSDDTLLVVAFHEGEQPAKDTGYPKRKGLTKLVFPTKGRIEHSDQYSSDTDHLAGTLSASGKRSANVSADRSLAEG